MRNTRILVNNGTYHVTARANRQEFIFEPDCIKEIFINVIKAAKKKYSFRIENFSIMSNHVHLMIKPLERSSLSKIMQWILSNFAIRFNKFYGIHGHVWYDRFKSKVVKTIQHYFAVHEYINNNPVKAGMVLNPEDYLYCGITFLKNKVFEVIDPPDIFLFLR